jgi:hypothetical protein
VVIEGIGNGKTIVRGSWANDEGQGEGQVVTTREKEFALPLLLCCLLEEYHLLKFFDLISLQKSLISLVYSVRSRAQTMDDIHMPTVPSGSQVNGVNGTEPKSFAELTAEKERLEGELSALSTVLDSVCSIQITV